jgi:hypothetical protein
MAHDVAAEVQSVLGWLEQHGTQANRDGMARFAIVADKMFGVSVGTTTQRGRRSHRALGRQGRAEGTHRSGGGAPAARSSRALTKPLAA